MSLCITLLSEFDVRSPLRTAISNFVPESACGQRKSTWVDDAESIAAGDPFTSTSVPFKRRDSPEASTDGVSDAARK